MQVKTLLRLSVAIAFAAIVMKTIAWWITGSVGLLSDAMESLVNVASALFALAMVTIAARPADEDHPFGHTKAEYFSSAFEGLMIAAAAIAIVWAAVAALPAPAAARGRRHRADPDRRELGPQRPARLEDDGCIAPASFGRPRGRCAPPVRRRLDVGRRRRRRDHGPADRLALARPGDRDRRCRQHHPRGCARRLGLGRRPDGQGGRARSAGEYRAHARALRRRARSASTTW